MISLVQRRKTSPIMYFCAKVVQNAIFMKQNINLHIVKTLVQYLLFSEI